MSLTGRWMEDIKRFRCRYLRIVFFMVMFLSGIFATFALPKNFFRRESLFSKGKWEKIRVKDSGLYELTYDELREMGFQEPEKVGIFGRNVTPFNENFTDSKGNVLFEDALNPVGALYLDDRIIFYAKGVENVELRRSVTVDERIRFADLYDSPGLSPYSNYNVYFLSDSGRTEMPRQTPKAIPENAVHLTQGVAYAFFGEQTQQLPGQTSRFFYWKELKQPEEEFRLPLEGYIEGSSFYINSSFLLQSTEGAVFNLECDEYINKLKLNNKDYVDAYSIGVCGKSYSGDAKVRMYRDEPQGDKFDAINHIICTYFKNLPSGSVPHNSRYQFAQIPEAESGYFKCGAQSCMAIDIRNPFSPKAILPSATDGRTLVIERKAGERAPEVIIFDSNRPLNKISGHTPVIKTDIRERLLAGGDMLVVTISALREKAERLAEIHRNSDGVRVVVATLPEIFNEFSGGNADAMGIRTAYKMMHTADNSLKNILLFGPTSSDPRFMNASEDFSSAFLPFPTDEYEQTPEMNIVPVYQPVVRINLDKGSEIYPEFYSLTNDYLRSDDIENWRTVNGAGILPVMTYAEADRILNKIERYLNDEHIAYRLNRCFFIAGPGDGQSHGISMNDVCDIFMKNFHNKILFNSFLLEAFPQKQWLDNFVNGINAEPLFVSYHGHGSVVQLSKDFFSRSDMHRLRNSGIPFLMFNGCELTNFDKGVRGIADDIILGSEHGCLGGVVPVRETLENSLKYFETNFFNVYQTMCKESGRPATVGEVLSHSKSRMRRREVGRLIMMCDPSLTLPLPIYGIEAEADSKEGWVEITGFITDIHGEKTREFDGEIVARILLPAEERSAVNYANPDEIHLPYIISDRTAQIVSGKVENGKFEINIPIRNTLRHGNKLQISLSAYDSKLRIGAATMLSTHAEPEEMERVEDSESPEIQVLEYDERRREIVIEVTDNLPLIAPVGSTDCSLLLTLDGRPMEGLFSTPVYPLESGNGYKKRIGVGMLADGEHILALTVRDNADNEAKDEKIFYTGLKTETLSIRFSHPALFDVIDISVEGGNEHDRMTAYIENASGEQVGTLSLERAKADGWDGTLDNGQKLVAGVYAIHVKSLSGESSAPRKLTVVR